MAGIFVISSVFIWPLMPRLLRTSGFFDSSVMTDLSRLNVATVSGSCARAKKQAASSA